MTLVVFMLVFQLPSGPELLNGSLEEQRAAMTRLTPAERTQVVAGLSIDELLALEARATAELGTYRAHVVRSERVGTVMQPTESMSACIQRSPRAIRLETLSGPSKGRRVLYNAALRVDELRAREPGLLGVVGGVWVGLDNSFTRRDSNHRLTDLGFEPVLALVQRIVTETRKVGALEKTYVRTDSSGVCLRFDAVPVAEVLYATSSLICFDPVTMLPMHFEISDRAGLFERYTWSQLETHVTVPANYFTLEGAGL